MTRRGHAVVALGESLAVMTSTAAGPITQPGSFTLSIGGAEGNVCVGLRRLGVSSAWIGRVGRDSFGDLVVKKLTDEGVAVFASTDRDAQTGLVMKQHLDADGTVIQYDRRGSAGSRLHTGDLPADIIGRASVLHVSGVTPGLSASAHMATLDAIAIARRMRVRVSFDVNHCNERWSDDSSRDLYSEIISLSDIVFAGEREAQVVVGSAQDPLELARRLVELGAREAVIRLGAAAAVADVCGRQYRQPGVAVDMVDPFGAGDGFVAGYLAEWLVGSPVARRLSTATAVGARACMVGGEWEGYPTRAELDRFPRADPVVR